MAIPISSLLSNDRLTIMRERLIIGEIRAI